MANNNASAVNDGKGGQEGMVAAFIAAIDDACAPNGAIHAAIHGAIHTSFQLQEMRDSSRYLNAKAASPTFSFAGLPAGDGVVPADFPATLGEFWTLPAATVDGLLLAYGLPAQGGVAAKKDRLAHFCRLSHPLPG
jgi:hypothetical protein